MGAARGGRRCRHIDLLRRPGRDVHEQRRLGRRLLLPHRVRGQVGLRVRRFGRRRFCCGPDSSLLRSGFLHGRAVPEPDQDAEAQRGDDPARGGDCRLHGRERGGVCSTFFARRSRQEFFFPTLDTVFFLDTCKLGSTKTICIHCMHLSIVKNACSATKTRSVALCVLAFRAGQLK